MGRIGNAASRAGNAARRAGDAALRTAYPSGEPKPGKQCPRCGGKPRECGNCAAKYGTA